MSKPHGWSKADWTNYLTSITGQSLWLSQVRILDRGHNLLATLPPTWASGQVDIDVDQDVDRALQLSIADTDGMLRRLLDPELAPRRYVQVLHGDWMPGWTRPLWHPVFTGPPTIVNTQGRVHDITAAGKESLWLVPSSKDKIEKGASVLSVIREGLKAVGEGNLIDFPPASVMTARVQRATWIGGSNDVARSRWKTWERLAAHAGWQLYVTGGGRYRLRRFPKASAPIYVFDSRTILSEPQWGTDLTAMRNRWSGAGAGTLHDTVNALGTFSGFKLAVGGDADGNGGVPWFATEFADQDDSLTTAKKLRQAGTDRLKRLSAYSASVTVDVVPFHAADPLDPLGFVAPSRSQVILLRQASIPVYGEVSNEDPGTDVADGWPMTIGRTHTVRRGRAGAHHITGKPPRGRHHRGHR